MCFPLFFLFFFSPVLLSPFLSVSLIFVFIKIINSSFIHVCTYKHFHNTASSPSFSFSSLSLLPLSLSPLLLHHPHPLLPKGMWWSWWCGFDQNSRLEVRKGRADCWALLLCFTVSMHMASGKSTGPKNADMWVNTCGTQLHSFLKEGESELFQVPLCVALYYLWGKCHIWSGCKVGTTLSWTPITLSLQLLPLACAHTLPPLLSSLILPSCPLYSFLPPHSSLPSSPPSLPLPSFLLQVSEAFAAQ